MTATLTDPPALYAVVDHRHDGRRRIVGEYVDPSVARAAGELLRTAGSDADVRIETPEVVCTLPSHEGPIVFANPEPASSVRRSRKRADYLGAAPQHG